MGEMTRQTASPLKCPQKGSMHSTVRTVRPVCPFCCCMVEGPPVIFFSSYSFPVFLFFGPGGGACSAYSGTFAVARST